MFFSFKLHAILGRMVKSHAILLCPAQDVSCLFVQCSHLPVSHLVACGQTRLSGRLRNTPVLVFQSPLFYLVMAPECKSSDAGNEDVPKRSRKLYHVYVRMEQT